MDTELKGVLQKTSDAITRLKTLTDREITIRSNMASDFKELEKKRKVAKKDSYMKL